MQQGQRIGMQAWPHLWIQRESTRSCQTECDDIEEVDCRGTPQPPPDSEQRRTSPSPHLFCFRATSTIISVLASFE